MSITINAVGNTLDVEVIDDNFAELERFFRERIGGVDFLGSFDRFRVSRWSSGKLESNHTFANPYRDSRTAGGAVDRTFLAINYRSAGEAAGQIVNALKREVGSARAATAMEFLGKPGPSFYYGFQEEGLQAPDVIVPGLALWPPTRYPHTRYPHDLCYSQWLTVPFASIRVYVPERCTVRIAGHGKGSLTPWGMARSIASGGADFTSHRYENMIRLGLIVDTNPVRYPDEFGNANRWVVEADGSMADYCTWKIVQDRTYKMAQREMFHAQGEVELQGRRTYNFRLAYRQAGHYGWIDQSAGPPEWRDEVWENGYERARGHMGAAVVSPFYDAWAASGWGSGLYDEWGSLVAVYPAPFAPPWTCLWENTGIDLEFDYGRGFPNLTNNLEADFSTMYEPVNP